ncbi:MAG TPA: phosphatidylserine decarboxylase [Kiritimatiellia bacterium]|nr:phosphatidylserine decarboxylase [Kiritimatiellia bacterium]HQQ03435.1 phosphatidylserine decarboxylase [Kiritimatiellia bacterium]
MKTGIVKCGWVWIIPPFVLGAAGWWLLTRAGYGAAGWTAAAAGLVLGSFMIYFHRDPQRIPPQEEGIILAGADGVIRRVEELHEPDYLQGPAVRISIYLNPFDVHVNRSPLGGRVTRLAYTPGKHMLTIMNAASEVNEHSSIFIENPRICCLVRQIVGPIVRRVVYWLKEGQEIAPGQTIGMMRFGSRLDIYLPSSRVKVIVKKGDRVSAGLTVVARIIN